MELRSLFHLNHSVVMPYSFFIIVMCYFTLRITYLPNRAINIYTSMPSALLGSYRNNLTSIALVSYTAFFVPMTVNKLPAVGTIHWDRCPFFFFQSNHLTKIINIFLFPTLVKASSASILLHGRFLRNSLTNTPSCCIINLRHICRVYRYDYTTTILACQYLLTN